MDSRPLMAVGALMSLLGATMSAAEPPVRKIAFEADVRPILVKACWSCHGSDAQEAGLRLDRKDRALEGGDNGRVIVPGKSAESKLIHLVTGTDPDKIMPPEGERLSAAEVDVLRAWIDQGLDWPASAQSTVQPGANHWAFQPIRRPAVPVVETPVPNPIDAFLMAELQKHGVAPSGAADRATLIRRLSLDLLGLLPTPDDVASFVADPRPDAYEQVVDQLLASPHFGERWGRHWLDRARYADSDGYEKDLPRPFAWRYRDWVIEATNADLPFDQFTVEQLAGDLLPNATTEQRMATGFHRQTLTNREGGIDKREDRDKQLVDRTNTTGAVWMGLTVGCAQCHTHKYDPISQREYYQLYAFFNAADEADIPAATEYETVRHAALKAEHERRRQPFVEAVEAYRASELPPRLAEWERRIREEPLAWTPLAITSAVTASKAELSRQEDGAYLIGGETPETDTYTLTCDVAAALPTGLRLETLTDAALPSQGPGRAPNGNFVLTEARVTWQPRDDKKAKPRPVALVAAQADYIQSRGQKGKAFAPENTLDGSAKTGWAVGGGIGQPHQIVWEFDWGTSPPTEDGRLTIVLDQQYGGQHLLGKFRLSMTDAVQPLYLATLPEWLKDAKPPALLEDYFANVDPGIRALAARLTAHDAAAPPAPETKAMVFAEAAKPEQTQIHLRGDFLQPGDEVSAATLAVLNPLKTAAASPNRLDLARWLASEDHPLVRRVAVNRVWQHLFGRGLVDPPDDVGLRGTPPSHPELLDWLADEFSTRGWSTKSLIRLIASSAAYQRSSAGRPDLRDSDPKNLLLARQNRFRLEGEVLRDVSLAVSGLLDDRVGGPSVRPPLPEGVASLGYANSVKWAESKGGDRYRRGCYIFFQRTVPYPLLMTFDSPDSNVACQRRDRSNTPLQSLTLLNDPAFFECARGLGSRLQQSQPDANTDRVQTLVQWCLGRDAAAAELAVLTRLHDEALAKFRDDPSSAAELIGRPAESPETLDLAACIALARVVLNVDEFLTRD
ncbi:MAG: PSD1 and planctomycete cytochrome C domain-containing protein [Planctomycetaceae bacterium]|nr:PSD1 and planctomycete cytochrome C domain-containing protein [Planctomycetaceae bacterium]